jgi:hypothetical protein
MDFKLNGSEPGISPTSQSDHKILQSLRCFLDVLKTTETLGIKFETEMNTQPIFPYYAWCTFYISL